MNHAYQIYVFQMCFRKSIKFFPYIYNGFKHYYDSWWSSGSPYYELSFELDAQLKRNNDVVYSTSPVFKTEYVVI